MAAKSQVRQAVNTAMVQTYWQIGRLIVEDEQSGQKHAAYGKQVLLELSKRLTTEFGAGFSVQGLRNYRQFYLQFPIRSTVWSELSWSHFKVLLRVENQAAREWYANEAAQQGWSVRALDRQIATLFYERLLGSQDKAKAGVALEAATNIAAEAPADPRDFIRDPSPKNKGFAFVSRQKNLRVDNEDCFIDLVFYNYLLKCFVLSSQFILITSKKSYRQPLFKS